VCRLEGACSLRNVVLLIACIVTVWVMASTGGVHAVGQAIDKVQVRIRGQKEQTGGPDWKKLNRERGRYLCLRLTARLFASALSGTAWRAGMLLLSAFFGKLFALSGRKYRTNGAIASCLEVPSSRAPGFSSLLLAHSGPTPPQRPHHGSVPRNTTIGRPSIFESNLTR
jgi:hypothetical protein